jgi:hypothetical protein
MRVFFDTNVYVAEALLGGAAELMVGATIQARWRILSSGYVLDETQRVLTEKFGFSQRYGHLTRKRIQRRATLINPPAIVFQTTRPIVQCCAQLLLRGLIFW